MIRDEFEAAAGAMETALDAPPSTMLSPQAVGLFGDDATDDDLMAMLKQNGENIRFATAEQPKSKLSVGF